MTLQVIDAAAVGPLWSEIMCNRIPLADAQEFAAEVERLVLTALVGPIVPDAFLPCPLCGHAEPAVTTIDAQHHLFRAMPHLAACCYIQCGGCTDFAIVRSNEAAARRAWNHRFYAPRALNAAAGKVPV